MPQGYASGANAAINAKIDPLLHQLEMDTLEDIVRRINKTGKITSSADWQVNRLAMLGSSSQDIEAAIQTATGKTQAEMAQLYVDAAQESYTRDRDLYTSVGKTQTPYAQNLELQQIIRGITEQTKGAIENITKSTGFMVPGPSGRLQFTPASDIYNKYLDKNLTAMLAGSFDYNTMIKKTVNELTSSGLRTVDYASGRSTRVDVAVRSALLTGYGQVTSQVTFRNAADLGTDLFEVTWHPGARPDHQLWQGKVYSRRELETICGYGTVAGLCGANCRHTFYPYLKGISQRQWSDQDLTQLDVKENKPKTFQGKAYTTYEATQAQRKLETTMRAYRERIYLLTQAEASEEDIDVVKARLRALKKRYKDLSAFFGLPEQWERVYTGRTPGRVL